MLSIKKKYDKHKRKFCRDVRRVLSVASEKSRDLYFIPRNNVKPFVAAAVALPVSFSGAPSSNPCSPRARGFKATWSQNLGTGARGRLRRGWRRQQQALGCRRLQPLWRCERNKGKGSDWGTVQRLGPSREDTGRVWV